MSGAPRTAADSIVELDRQIQASPDEPGLYVERGKRRFRAAQRESWEQRLESCERAWADFQKAHELAGGTWDFGFKAWASPDSEEGQARPTDTSDTRGRGKGSARALTEAARMCLGLFRPDLASTLMERAWIIAPADPYVELVCLQLEGLATGEWPRVNTELKRLVESAELRGNSTAWFVYGFGLMTAGDNDGAEEAYRKCLELDPGEDGARSNLVTVLATQNRMEEAMKLREEIQGSGSMEVYTDMNFAVSLMSKGRFDEATPILMSVTQRAPGLPAGWMNLAGCYLKTKRFDEAVRAYEVLNALMPQEATGLALLGYTYTQMGKFDEAIETLGRAAQLPSATYSEQLGLFLAYEGAGQLDKAERALKRAWVMDSTATPVLNTYGQYLRKSQRFAELAQLMSSVIADAPNRAIPWGWRATARMEMGEFEKALDDQSKVVELAPNASNFLNYALMLRLAERPTDEVVAKLEKALHEYPGHAYASAMLWVVARDSGDEDRAVQAIRAAVAKADPDNWYGRIARYLAGELSQSELVDSAADDGQRCEAHYFIAEKTRLTGKPEEAEAWFAKCVALGQEAYWEHKLSRRHLAEHADEKLPADEQAGGEEPTKELP